MINDEVVGKTVKNNLKICDNDMNYLKGICEKTNDAYSYCNRADLSAYIFERVPNDRPRSELRLRHLISI